MTVLILSDTHGHADRVESLLDRPSIRPDAILFAGDGVRDLSYLSLPCSLYAVCGNNDSPTLAQSELTVDLDGIRLFLTHGHRFGVKSGTERLLMHAVARGADAVIYGHTHRPHEEYVPAGTRVGDTVLEKGLWLFNPGSLGDREASFGTLEIRGGQLLFGHGRL